MFMLLRTRPDRKSRSRKRKAAPSFLDPLGRRTGRSPALGALAGLFAAWFSCAALTAQAEIIVVADDACPIEILSKPQIADLYLGRTTHLPGIGPVIPLDLGNDQELRDHFYRRITGKNAAQIKAHWARMYFTGRGVQPREAEDTRELKTLMATHKNMIGYMKKTDTDPSLKVLYVQP